MRAGSVAGRVTGEGGRAACLGLAAFLLFGGASASAQENQTATFSQAMETFAGEIKEFTDKRGGQIGKIDAFVEDVKGEGTQGVSGGKIQIALDKALTKCGCGVQKGGMWAVRGQYACEVENQRARISITAEIVTNAPQPKVQTSVLLKKTLDVKALDEVIELKGDVNFDATPKSPPNGGSTTGQAAETADRESALAIAIAKPDVQVRNNVGSQATLVSPRPDSQFAIEICRIQNGRATALPATVVESNGVESAVVTVGRNDKFGVRIRNGATHGVGVRLLIDGISMFQFSKTYEKTAETQLLYLGRQKTAFIPGWHVTNESSLEFTIADLPESVYASVIESQRKPDRLGTITVEYFPAWEDGEQKPVASKGSTEDAVAVGAGAVINVPYATKNVNFDVYPLAAVSVRYQLPPQEQKAAALPDDLPADAGIPAGGNPGK